MAEQAAPIVESFDGDLSGWTVSNCRIDEAAGALVLGLTADTCDGAIGYVETAVQGAWNRTGIFTAEVDLGANARAVRSIEIRVNKGSDMVVCARVLAFAKGRGTDAEKHVLLSVGSYVPSTKTATRTQADLGDVPANGTLRLEVGNSDAKAYFNSSPTGDLSVATAEKISGARLGLMGDRNLVSVSVTSFNAQP